MINNILKELFNKNHLTTNDLDILKIYIIKPKYYYLLMINYYYYYINLIMEA